MKGETTSPVQSGKIVKVGKIELPRIGTVSLRDSEGPSPLSTESPPTSTILRRAMMTSMNQRVKRSTTSAQVIWKRLSFSIFLKTDDFISTNWLERSRVRSALE